MQFSANLLLSFVFSDNWALVPDCAHPETGVFG
jgi:hypothetical protein